MKNFLSSTLFLFIASCSFIQTKVFSQQLFTVYDTSNTSLVVNQINCITEKNNILWAGTDYGFTSFDGSNWNFFLFNNQAQSFANNILSIAVDDSGNKWIGSGGAGLGKFDGTNWTIYNTTNTQLPSNIIKAITFDSQNRLWIGTTGGLAIWDLDTTWIVYQQFTSPLTSNNINCITRGVNDTMWIGTVNGGMYRLVNDSSWKQFIIANGGVPDNTIIDIALDTAGNRWLGCAAHGLGSFHYDSPPYIELSPANSDITSYTVNAVAIDSGNKILCATATGGLCKYLGSIYWQIFSPQTIGLPDSVLNDLLIDSNGSIWLASENAGIIRFDEMVLGENEIENSKFENQLLNIYPNPSSDFIRFHLSNIIQKEMNVQLFDATGKLLRNDFINSDFLNSEIRMNISSLTSGTYFLKIISGGKYYSGIFLKSE